MFVPKNIMEKITREWSIHSSCSPEIIIIVNESRRLKMGESGA
jgi:hypothetical protein